VDFLLDHLLDYVSEEFFLFCLLLILNGSLLLLFRTLVRLALRVLLHTFSKALHPVEVEFNSEAVSIGLRRYFQQLNIVKKTFNWHFGHDNVGHTVRLVDRSLHTECEPRNLLRIKDILHVLDVYSGLKAFRLIEVARFLHFSECEWRQLEFFRLSIFEVL